MSVGLGAMGLVTFLALLTEYPPVWHILPFGAFLNVTAIGWIIAVALRVFRHGSDQPVEVAVETWSSSMRMR